jgi:hypothetical protein
MTFAMHMPVVAAARLMGADDTRPWRIVLSFGSIRPEPKTVIIAIGHPGRDGINGTFLRHDAP